MTPVPPPVEDPFSQQVRRSLHALPDVPPALQRAAIGLWPAAGRAHPAAALARAVLVRISALLSFDSWAAAAGAPSVRSLRSATRHLLFAAQGRDIDLRIAPTPASPTPASPTPASPSNIAFCLTGQVLGPDETGAVLLTRIDPPGAAPRHAVLDGLGEFRIDAVPAGAYRLTLHLGPDAIDLPVLQVGEPTDDAPGLTAADPTAADPTAAEPLAGPPLEPGP